MYRRIKDLRDDADLTQEQIAEVLGVHRITYIKYETSEREMPFNVAISLAKYYGVSLDYIAGLTNKK